MKNKKLVLVFIMMIAFLTMMIIKVSATDELTNIGGDLPVVGVGNEETGNQTPENNNTTVGNNITGNNVALNNTVGNNQTLPQTGVEENTMLLIAFMGIFTVSAVYAYRKVRTYNSL